MLRACSSPPSSPWATSTSGIALVLVLVINTVPSSARGSRPDAEVVNKVAYLDDDTLKARYPHVHAIIHDVARERGLKAPSVGIIPDRNPTAFTYGLFRSSARIVLTDGIFEFLNEEETRAVVAHELGHIVHLDFLVMTVAGTLVQMLYVIYSSSPGVTRRQLEEQNNQAIIGRRLRDGRARHLHPALLSRTREYLADAFAAERVESAPPRQRPGQDRLRHRRGQRLPREDARAPRLDAPHGRLSTTKAPARWAFVVEASKLNPDATANAMLFDVYNLMGQARGAELHASPGLESASRHSATSPKPGASRSQEIDIEGAARRAKVDTGRPLEQVSLRELALLAIPTAVSLIGGYMALREMVKPWIAILAVPLSGFFPGPADPDHVSVLAAREHQCRRSDGRRRRLSSHRPTRPTRGRSHRRVAAGSIVGEDTMFADSISAWQSTFAHFWVALGDLWTGHGARRTSARKGEVGRSVAAWVATSS